MEPIGLTTLGVGLGALGSYYYHHHLTQKRGNYPPGPTPIPFLGNLLGIGPKPYVAFDSFGKKYGPIFSVHLGTNPAVVITDVKIMSEAFNDPRFAGKPNNKIFTVLAGGSFGFNSSNPEAWTGQREFATAFLQGLHSGTTPLETIIAQEVHEILAYLKSQDGTVVNLELKFKLSALNLLWNLFAGARFESNDPKLMAMYDAAEKTFEDLTSSLFVLFFPGAAKIFSCCSGWDKLDGSVAGIRAIYSTSISQHEVKTESNPPHFIDDYLKKIAETSDPTSTFYTDTGRKSLLANLGDLHASTFAPLAAILSWSILYLLVHPAVRDKFVAEIDTVIGPNETPTLYHKSKMPYTEALLMEVLRFSALVPLGVFHSTTTDVEFHGYTIPKDTMIILNLYSALYDVNAWGDPFNFRPERFLSQDETTVIQNESFVPHSVGLRACLGQKLVRETMFWFLTSIYQRFELSPDPKASNPSMEPNVGFLQTPKPFNVIVKQRN